MKIIIFFLFFTTTAFATCEGLKVDTKIMANISVYTPKNPTDRQVVLLPPTGGENVADKALAKALCKMGHLVKVVDYPQDEAVVDDYNCHERITNEVLQIFNQVFAGETKKTTILGSSLGGIYAGLVYDLALSNKPEWKNFSVIDSAVLTVAGGPLPTVLTYSTLTGVKTIRDARFATGMFKDLQEYEEYLDQRIFTDVVKLNRSNGKLLLFTSNNDKVVPTKTQLELARAYNVKPIVVKHLGHMGTIAFVYFTQAKKIHSFLKSI